MYHADTQGPRLTSGAAQRSFLDTALNVAIKNNCQFLYAWLPIVRISWEGRALPASITLPGQPLIPDPRRTFAFSLTG